MLFVDSYTETTEQLIGSVPIMIFSLILAYTSMAYLVNTTEVTVENELVTVRHGPLPWRGRRYRLRDCQNFRADKIFESRFTSDGVRIRFIDDTFENLVYTEDAEEAEEWAQFLNEQLFLLKTRRR